MRRGCGLVYAHHLTSTERVFFSIVALLSNKSAMGAAAVPPQLAMARHAPPMLPAPALMPLRQAKLGPAARWQSVSATTPAAAASTVSRHSQAADSLATSDAAERMLQSGMTSAAQTSQAVRPPPGCQVPLCERPAQHTASADALRAWLAAAVAAIDDIGDQHAAQGGGSTRDELKARALSSGGPRHVSCCCCRQLRKPCVVTHALSRLSMRCIAVLKLQAGERSASWAGCSKTRSPLSAPTAAAAGGTRVGGAPSCCSTAGQHCRRGRRMLGRRRKCCSEHHSPSCRCGSKAPIAALAMAALLSLHDVDWSPGRQPNLL